MSWLAGPEIRALAGTLLHSLWEGALVALALALVLCIVRNCRIRYFASCVAMLVLAGGLGVTFTHLAPAPPNAPQVTGSGRAAVAASAFDHHLPTVSSRGAEQADYLGWVAPFWMAGV